MLMVSVRFYLCLGKFTCQNKSNCVVFVMVELGFSLA